MPILGRCDFHEGGGESQDTFGRERSSVDSATIVSEVLSVRKAECVQGYWSIDAADSES